MRDSHDRIERRLLSLEQSLPTKLAVECIDVAALSAARREIFDDLAILEKALSDLSLIAEDHEDEAWRLQDLGKVQGYYNRIEHIRGITRESSLAAARRIHSREMGSQRATLLGDKKISAHQIAAYSDDELMNATTDVTSSLRKTMQMMQQELDRSLVSNQLLEQSSSSMLLATDQHGTFSDLLGLAFFVGVCLWILKRRFIDKGLRAAQTASSLMGRIAAKPSSLAALKEELATHPMALTLAKAGCATPTSNMVIKDIGRIREEL